jgi:exosortase/archaeosortase
VIPQDLITHGVVVYIDIILIYTENTEELVWLTREVLCQLQAKNFAIAPNQCQCHQKNIEFLAYIILEGGVSMFKYKIDTILQWKILESVKDIQWMLGFANLYQHFIAGIWKIFPPITELTKQEM